MANRRGSGRGGRKPKPVRLKILEGTRKDRIPLDSPQAPPGHPERPEFLDEYAVEGWAWITKAVEALGLLSAVDRGLFVIFASAYSRFRRGSALIDAGDANTKWLVTMVERAERQMMTCLAECGLTPSARSRLKATEQKGGDPFEEFLKNSV